MDTWVQCCTECEWSKPKGMCKRSAYIISTFSPTEVRPNQYDELSLKIAPVVDVQDKSFISSDDSGFDIEKERFFSIVKFTEDTNSLIEQETRVVVCFSLNREWAPLLV